eukprot:494463_1
MPTEYTTENILITLTTIVAIITAILTTIIAVVILRYFINPQQKQKKIMTMKSVENSKNPKSQTPNQHNKSEGKSDNQDKQKTKTVKIATYFAYSGSAVVIFNALCSIFNAIFCIYLMIDPEDDKMIFYKHPSYFLRILSTIAWYLGTGSVIWFFNGRLFYVFNGSTFRTSKRLFKFINIFITVYGFISLICAYTAVYLDSLIGQELAFTSFRFSYQIIIFIILYMFCKRLLVLNMQNQSLSVMSSSCKTATNTSPDPISPNMAVQVSSPSADSPAADNNNYNPPQNLDRSIMELTAKNSVLVFITAASVFLVTFSWTAFRWISTPSRTTLLIPMNMASIDSLVNSVSIIMLFSFGNKLYDSCCSCCHKCCVTMCIRSGKCITVNDVFI